MPTGVAYAEVEDRRARDLLEANGVPLEPEAIVKALDSGIEVIQGAAAHVAGELGLREAVPKLRAIAATPDDTVRAEAGFALARMDEDGGREALAECIQLPVEAYLSAGTAAGFLARLGDPSGFPNVERALASANQIIRMVGVKQLYFFAGLEGVDPFPLFERALADDDPGIRSTALAQLRELDDPRAKRLVESASDS